MMTRQKIVQYFVYFAPENGFSARANAPASGKLV
jgi:hypothetical protein